MDQDGGPASTRIVTKTVPSTFSVSCPFEDTNSQSTRSSFVGYCLLEVVPRIAPWKRPSGHPLKKIPTQTWHQHIDPTQNRRRRLEASSGGWDGAHSVSLGYAQTTIKLDGHATMRLCYLATSITWLSFTAKILDWRTGSGGGWPRPWSRPRATTKDFHSKKIRNSVHTQTASADMTATFHLLQLFLTSLRSIGLLLMIWLASNSKQRRQIRAAETFQRARLRERREIERERRGGGRDRKREPRRERERERERERGRDEERALKQGSACDMHVQPTFFSLFRGQPLWSLGHWRRNGRDGGVSSPFPLSSECQCKKQLW